MSHSGTSPRSLRASQTLGRSKRPQTTTDRRIYARPSAQHPPKANEEERSRTRKGSSTLAKRLLHHDGLVFLKTSPLGGLPIFLKVNHQLESRTREIRPFGSEGGAKLPSSLPLSFIPFRP